MKNVKLRRSASVKTVEIQTVKIGRNIASQTETPAKDRATFARKIVEESRSRSRALYEAKVG